VFFLLIVCILFYIMYIVQFNIILHTILYNIHLQYVKIRS